MKNIYISVTGNIFLGGRANFILFYLFVGLIYLFVFHRAKRNKEKINLEPLIILGGKCSVC